MIGVGVNWDTAAMALTELRLKQFASRVRRNILMTVGRKAVVPMLAAMRGGGFPVVNNVLATSFTKKVNAYAGTCSMFAIVGAKSKKVAVTQYKDYRTGQIRAWRLGQPKKGQKIQNPARYIRLAGPGRRDRVVNRLSSSLRTKMQSVVTDTLREEVMRR